MSRVIKFRCWDAGRERYCNATENAIDGTGMLYWSGPGGGEIIPLPADQFIVEQFTGLTDADGVEIYEGDILQFEYGGDTFTTGPVGWKADVCCFGSEIWLDGCIPEDLFIQHAAPECYRVIGNIHEHPELLK